MLALRHDFQREFCKLREEIAGLAGFLAPRDIYLLALAAAHPTAAGEVLEIGAFRGKSTVLLSKAAGLAGNPRIVSCDPLTWSQAAIAPSPEQARTEFDTNLREHGVRRQIEFHQMTSAALGQRWSRPIRLLWVDGDHSYAGVKSDLKLFAPHLADGGMLLMHDVLSAWPGANRAYLEDVLASPHFGPCGIHGNVAWAQYHRDPGQAAPYAAAKQILARRLRPLIPYQTSEHGQRVLFGWRKLCFKLLRAQALWSSPPAQSWLEPPLAPAPKLQWA